MTHPPAEVHLTSTTFLLRAHVGMKQRHRQQSGLGRCGVYWLQFLGASLQCKKNRQTKTDWNNYNFFKNPVNNFQSFLYILTKLFFKTNTK